ncbi:hypothetical protein C8F04DRAFT_104519 [Mycena alexandri]|uniref:Protein kinase domain-containing protein n=1 Tax=Mycena alexandri TaxID=1745969 RepID=A0AAD6WVG9_9AGAR|nr:hypothetical protein C8F04DRAFT_104519 [Mycena alexandri]
MAPELLDPGPFGLKFSRTAATDVYAFGCVCFELYTGRPPFAELGPATLMKVVTGERPERPSDAPLMSDALWQHVTGYWGQTPSARPTSSIVVQDMVWPLPGSKARRPLPPLPLSAPSTVSARSNTASRSIHGTTSVSPVKVSPARTPPGESTAWFSTNDDEIDRGGSQRRLARPKRPSVQDIMNSFNSPPAPGLASALSPHHDESDHSHSVPERHHRRQRGRGKGKEHRREDDIHVISPLAVPTDHLVGNTSSHSRSPSPEDMLRLQHETRPVLPVLRLSDTQDGSPGLHSRSASDTPHLRPVYVRSRVRSASLGDVPRLYEAKTLDDCMFLIFRRL